MPKRLYDTTAWRRASRAHLARHPLCTYCEARGRIAAANAVDHVRATPWRPGAVLGKG